MWQKTLQQRLRVSIDGILGPVSYAAMLRHMGAAPDMAAYLAAGAAKHLKRYAIDATPQRLTEWMGEMAHESAGFRRLQESLSYSSADRIRAVWPSRFRTRESAQPFVRAPESLANKVYANRLGNGPPESGDGWRFRGRGLIHLTGRDNYRASGQRLGLPLVDNPNLAADPETAVLIAAEWWHRADLNPLADRSQSDAITRKINGGTNGLTDRRQRKAAFRSLWA